MTTNTNPTIINLTPHPITLRDSAGALIAEVMPSGTIARVEESIATAAPIGRIRTTCTYPRSLVGLPAPAPGTWYVVSAMTADAADALGRGTADLLLPGQQTRDADGRVNGCASLVRYLPMRRRLDHPTDFAVESLVDFAIWSAAVKTGVVIDRDGVSRRDALSALLTAAADLTGAAPALTADELRLIGTWADSAAEEYQRLGMRSSGAVADAQALAAKCRRLAINARPR